jgi:hypothetical protein
LIGFTLDKNPVLAEGDDQNKVEDEGEDDRENERDDEGEKDSGTEQMLKE